MLYALLFIFDFDFSFYLNKQTFQSLKVNMLGDLWIKLKCKRSGINHVKKRSCKKLAFFIE